MNYPGIFSALRVWHSFLRLDLGGVRLRAAAALRGSFVDRGCRCVNRGVVRMGRRVVIQRHAMISVLPGAELVIGDHSRIGSDSVIACGRRIAIGDSVLIAARCYIGDYGHAFGDPARPVMDQGADKARPVEIGGGSWLGINVCILPGVSLGRNCVVAANAVVRDSFPDGSVLAGAPARLVRSLPGA